MKQLVAQHKVCNNRSEMKVVKRESWNEGSPKTEFAKPNTSKESSNIKVPTHKFRNDDSETEEPQWKFGVTIYKIDVLKQQLWNGSSETPTHES